MSEMLEKMTQIVKAIREDEAANPVRTALEADLREQFAWSLAAEEAIRKLATALVAKGWTKPRTITTAEELPELDAETVVKDASGAVWIVSEESDPNWDIAQLPITILWEPNND